MTKIREIWVDIAKGIAIIAVVLGHIDYSYPQITWLPLSDMLSDFWHVPVFFLIGGFFLTEQKLTKPFTFIRGKLKSLYLLLLYIYIPILFLHNFFIEIGFYDLQFDYSGKSVTYWTIPDLIKNILFAVFGAGREPILGAMWFVYVLFFALCLLSIMSWAIRTKANNDRQYEQIRFFVLLFFAMVSSILTQIFDITIPRFNNVFTAAWLIYLGMLLNQRRKERFDQKVMLFLSILVAFYLMVIYRDGVGLNTNRFPDIVTLTVSSIACLYIVCYLSKKVQYSLLGKLLGVIGKDSFYIMGLQFVGFKICTMLALCFGCTDIPLAQLKAPAGDCLLLFIMYLLFGVLVPIIVITSFRLVKSQFLKYIH